MRNSTLVFLLLAGLSVTASTQAAVDKKQAAKDWAELAELAIQYRREFQSESDFTNKGAAFPAAWQAWKKRFTPLMERFKKDYGATANDVGRAFEGLQTPAGVSEDPRQLFSQVGDLNVAEREKQYAEWALEAGQDAFRSWKNFKITDPQKKELKLDYTERALRNFKLAKELDPAGDYDDLIGEAQAAYDKTKPEFMEALAGLEWPGHNAEFAGPGDPDELAEAALEYLRKAKSWSKPEYDDEHTPIAACVTAKEWVVSKKTILNVPTQYSLNVFVAFAGAKDKDLAYCYQMVFYTAEKEGVKKELPFKYANSRQYAKFKMQMSKVKKAAGISGGDGGATSGFFGFMFRLLLAASLFAGGLVAAAEVLKAKAPPLGKACQSLAFFGDQLGLLLAAVGGVCFLRVLLFHFAPFTDLLPQAALIVVGLVLAGKLEKLKDKQTIIGLACLALGAIHLLLGGIWLF